MINLESILYVVSSILFIIGIKRLSHPKTARSGNFIASLGMLIAIITTLVSSATVNLELVAIGIIVGSVIGAFFAIRVEMTQMPQMVAIFNGFGGIASALIAAAEFLNPSEPLLSFSLATISLSVFVGTLTFTGSFIAFGKLQGFISGQPIVFFGQQFLNAIIGISILGLSIYIVLDPEQINIFYLIIAASAIIGIGLTIPIGGADMPVVVSLLNSLSGIAAAFTGFIIGNSVLIVAGSLVGASGLILTVIMCKAMNRQLIDVLFKSFGGSEKQELTRTKVGSDADEVAMMADGAQKIIIVPGYGMAVSQCQHQVKEFADLMAEKFDTEIKYAIHPVAGRMPGHMNVLLAEANVPYEQLIEMDEINSEFSECDMAIVIGANDTCNPAARTGEGPLAGMPIIDADQARTVVIIKRSLSVGYAGVDNDLFYEDKTMMLFGDGKAMMTQLNNAIKDL